MCIRDRCYTVKEIQDILGISRPTVYELLKKNEFHWIQIGASGDTELFEKASNINAFWERWSADCCGKQNRYNHSKASKSGSMKSDKNLDFSRLPRYNKI